MASIDTLPLGNQIIRFLDDSYEPDTEFELVDLESALVVHDAEKEMIGHRRELFEIVGVQLEKYLGGVDWVAATRTMSEAMDRAPDGKRHYFGFPKVTDYERLLLIRGNKVLESVKVGLDYEEPEGQETMRIRTLLVGARGARARLSRIDDATIEELRGLLSEIDGSMFVALGEFYKSNLPTQTSSRQGTLAVLPVEVPPRSGVVSDVADAVSTQTKETVSVIANGLTKRTGAKLLILTVEHYTPYSSVQDLAVEVMRKWGVAESGGDRSVLIVCAVQNQKVHVHFGAGLLHVVADTLAAEIEEYLAYAISDRALDVGLLAAAAMLNNAIVSGTPE